MYAGLTITKGTPAFPALCSTIWSRARCPKGDGLAVKRTVSNQGLMLYTERPQSTQTPRYLWGATTVPLLSRILIRPAQCSVMLFFDPRGMVHSKNCGHSITPRLRGHAISLK